MSSDYTPPPNVVAPSQTVNLGEGKAFTVNDDDATAILTLTDGGAGSDTAVVGAPVLECNQLKADNGIICNNTLSFTNTAPNGQVSRYNNVVTAGVGVSPIYASVMQSSLAATTSSAATYTPPAAFGIYEVGFVAQIVTSGSVSMQVQVAYTNEKTTGITAEVIGCFNGNGSAIATGTIATTGKYSGRSLIWTDASASPISLKTAGTTATLYDLYTYIKQVA